MPIPFHDAEEIEELGAAAFLHIERAAGSTERLGAVLVINGRGEPLEFVYNRIELLSSLLWRPSDRELAAARRLTLTLFQTATLTPVLLLCRAHAVPTQLFGPHGQLAVDVPVGRLATPEEAVGYTGLEGQETVATTARGGEETESHLFWMAAPPEGVASDLFALLRERGLLLEPFEAAAIGLREVYGEDAGPTRPARLCK